MLTIALGIGSNASVDGFVRGLAQYGQRAGDPLTPELIAALDRISRLLRMAAVAVFVIACGNVASFLLSRAAARSRDTALRVAIGATRGQLIRQVLADSIIIGIAGAAGGAVMAFWIARLVPALLFDQDAEQMLFALDRGNVLLITAACTAVTVVCGLLPLIELRHDQPAAIMQRETAGPSRASATLRSGLVVVQMAACTLLVISAGLLLAGFKSALQTSAARRLSAPIVVSMEALQTSSKSVERANGLGYFEAASRALREVAGTTSFTWTASVPGNRPALQAFAVETPRMATRSLKLISTPFTRSTFNTIATPPIAGRLFGAIDSGPCGGVVITREAAREIGGDTIVGRSIETPAGQWVEVVGVVAALDDPTPRVYRYMPDAEEPYPAAESASFRALQPSGSQRIELDVNIVARNYFEFMGLPLIAGRTFDQHADACRVAIVNKEAADLYFDGDAVGGAIIDGRGRRTAIAGVVESNRLRASQRPVQPTIYLPMDQDYLFRMTMIAETGGTSAAVRTRLLRRLQTIPGGREDRIIVTTLDHHLSRTAYAPERIASVLVGSSAAVALLLGMLGLYGTMSDAARRRQREFALRIALGARSGHVVGQVVAEGLRLVAVGSVLGLLGSIVVARTVSEVAPIEGMPSPWIWIAAPSVLALAVAIAGVMPARGAAATDPLTLMRDDS